MIGNKTAKYRNSLGRELVFDNRTLFIESIDMTGASGLHTVESLLGADGQTTIDSVLQAKTIPCEFALKDTSGNGWLRRELADIFSPKLGGVLTVWTRFGRYEIDVRPKDNPSFKQDSENDFVYRWSVDFVADFPYWRYGDEHTVTLTAGQDVVVRSNCIYDIAPKIYFPATDYNSLIKQGGRVCVSIYAHPNTDIKLDTLTFRITNAQTGENCNNLVDASNDLSNIRLKYGTNAFNFSYNSNADTTSALMTYYNLSQGEI